ncbi:MAG: chemotaxis protein CheW [Roseobacter sp.]
MTNPIEYLSFEVSGEGYAIDIALTREIRGWTEPSLMPDTPDFEMGVINLRGEMLPLIDLAAKLGLPSPEIHERSVIIVAEVQGLAVGLLVDSVSNIIAPSDDDLKAPPEINNGTRNAYVSALTVIDEKMVRILDLATALSTVEEAA